MLLEPRLHTVKGKHRSRTWAEPDPDKKPGLNFVFPHATALPGLLFLVFAEPGADAQKCISRYPFTITTELITDTSQRGFAHQGELCEPTAACSITPRPSCHPPEPRAAIAATAVSSWPPPNPRCAPLHSPPPRLHISQDNVPPSPEGRAFSVRPDGCTNPSPVTTVTSMLPLNQQNATRPLKKQQQRAGNSGSCWYLSAGEGVGEWKAYPGASPSCGLPQCRL